MLFYHVMLTERILNRIRPPRIGMESQRIPPLPGTMKKTPVKFNSFLAQNGPSILKAATDPRQTEEYGKPYPRWQPGRTTKWTLCSDSLTL